MPSRKQHLEHLSKVRLFAGLSKKALEKVARAGDEVTMTEGSLVVDQGQTGREAFVILDGAVTLKRNGRKVATLGPGDVLGELSLLDHGPRTATAVCDTDCTMFVLEQRHFIGVIDDVPGLGVKLLSTLASRLRDLDRKYYG